jgi:hypothetical protein
MNLEAAKEGIYLIAALIAIGGVGWGTFQHVRSRLAKQGEEFDAILEGFRELSGTVAARTDLGLFLLSVILRMGRFYQWAFFTSTIIMCLGLVSAFSGIYAVDGLPGKLSIVVGLGACTLGVGLHLVQLRTSLRTDKLHDLFDELWGQALAAHRKRLKPRADEGHD